MAELSDALAAFIPRFIQIESGGDPNARTGSYTGLLQMGPDEIAKYGGNGLEQGKQLLADRAAQFEQTYGRQPTPTELYLGHQQGMGGLGAHLSNPDAPAWQNMASTGEGRKKGEGWAKAAIWGNIPDGMKAQFGDVNNVTSQQFMDLWRSKVEGRPIPASAPANPTQAPFQPQKPLPPQPLNIAQPAAPAPQLPAFPWSPGAQQQAPQQARAEQTPQMQPIQFAPQRPVDLTRLRLALSQLRPSFLRG